MPTTIPGFRPVLEKYSMVVPRIFGRLLDFWRYDVPRFFANLRFPGSLIILGPRFRRVSDTPLSIVRESLRDKETCLLHALCSNCANFFCKSRLIHGSWLWLVPTVEYFTLHRSVEDFDDAVAAGCHLCTLLWEQFYPESTSDEEDYENSHPNLDSNNEKANSNRSESGSELGCDYKPFMVCVRLSIDEEFGVSKLELTAIITTELQIRPAELDWGAWQQARLNMDTRFRYNRGSLYSKFSPHLAHSNLSTSSTAHRDMINFWLSDCLSNHKHCGSKHSGFVPKRLIAIEPSLAKLYLTSVDDNSTRYCALSHCWGGAEDIPVLTTEKLQSFTAGFSIDELPQTFKDAISITDSLGVQFLWIDCLCIIQDSLDDWVTESAAMGLIYENSTCTILAAAAADAHQGCFSSRNPLSYAPCRVAGSGKRALFASNSRLSHYTGQLETPLYERAWTFQERLLPPRVLEFGKYGVSWRCMVGEASEIKPYGSGRYRKGTATLPSSGKIFGPAAKYQDLQIYTSGFLEFFARLQGLSVAQDVEDRRARPVEPFTFRQCLFGIVREYSKGKLTRSSDKLVALSGIAERVKNAFPDAVYLAGLWSPTLELDLLWYVSGVPEPHSQHYRSPTWSWASTAGIIVSIAGIETPYTSMMRIVSVVIGAHPLDALKCGSITGGKLEIEGLVKSISALRFVPQPQKYKNCLGMDILEGEEKLGHMLPDFSGPGRVTHLLPLRKTPRGTRGQPFSKDGPPIWLTGFPFQAFWGLALDARGDCFVRVGFFGMEWEDDGAHASRWFDDCVQQNVIIV